MRESVQVLHLCALVAPNHDTTFSMSIVWTAIQLLCSSFFLNFSVVSYAVLYADGMLSSNRRFPCSPRHSALHTAGHDAQRKFLKSMGAVVWLKGRVPASLINWVTRHVFLVGPRPVPRVCTAGVHAVADAAAVHLSSLFFTGGTRAERVQRAHQ